MRLILSTFCAVWIAVSFGSSAHAQQPASAKPAVVQVGLFALEPDGSVVALALGAHEDTFEPFAASLFSDGCNPGAGPVLSASNMPERDAWRIHGHVISLSKDRATVQLDWQKVRSSGATVSGPRQSQQLTLVIDQLTTFETLATSNDPRCGFPKIVFGARYGPSPRISDSADNGLRDQSLRARRLRE